VDDDGGEKKDDDDRDEDAVVVSLPYRPYWNYWIDEKDDYHYDNLHHPDACHERVVSTAIMIVIVSTTIVLLILMMIQHG